MSRFCVKKPFTVLVGVVMVLVLGFISFTKITTDLFPSISLPYVLAITTYPGATPEKVESSVTEVLESSLGTVNGVKNVMSVSSENYSMVTLEFEDGTNMDSAMVKLSTAIEQLTAALPDEAGKPMLMEISPDMLPTLTVSVDYEGKDVKELSKFTKEELIPFLERQDGVASVNTTGITEESVEIRLNQSKIDDVNDRLLAKLDSTFAEAKATLSQKEGELNAAAAQIAGGKEQLGKEQDKSYDELAKYSQMLDEAIATSASYQAQVNGLKTSQAALDAEKEAYETELLPAYNQLNSVLKSLGQQTGKNLSVSEILKDDTKQTFYMVKAMIKNMAQMQPSNQQLKELDQSFTWENLTLMEEKVTVRIPQIQTELANLNTEIQAAQTVLDQVNLQVSDAKKNYTSVEKGKLTAAAAFGAASAQLSAGESQIASAQAQLNEARSQYESARETALKSANINALVDMNTLSQLIYAQNFEMPAGYIKNGEDQILLKVGEQFQTLEDLKGTLLCTLDGIGDVRLADVADVTIIDNSEESYAKINGNDAVMLSIMKASTAGTSDVSKELGKAIRELEEKYDGLHITTMMDQGDYIKLIIRSVLQNLIFGAILAIIVLAIFLKDVKPTMVVAFSIPLSVLFAIVLMYFSDVTLNVISLSGLALGVGMLVDNSIVVIENIYRLRAKGLSAPKAAVLGARQVSGAIFASTLTTICVFLPIVFTEGLTRELFSDMGLTIGYSLVASLIVALTFVPTMSATVLKNSQEKKHPLFDKVIDGYEKAIRYCLNKKIVPLGIAIALLVISIFGVTRMGLELIPAMSSNTINLTVDMNEELEQDQIYKEVDQILAKIEKIEGIETVGSMSGGGAMNMGALAGGASNEKNTQFTIYAILDEQHANDGDQVAKTIEKMGKGKEDLYELTASASSMDMSALGGSGMQIRIEGKELDQILKISEDMKAMLEEVKGFENVSNGQEEGDTGIRLSLDKDAAMRHGLTVAQIYSELAAGLKTETQSIKLTLEGNEYQVVIIDENDPLTLENLMDYSFETKKKDEQGNDITEVHKLQEFATKEDSSSIASIHRDNQARYLNVTAETKEGYNTSLLSREVEKKLKDYKVPEGYSVEIAGEVTNIQDTMIDLVQMIALAIAFIYMIMVAQFQSLLSPFIVLFTIPLAFTGGLLAIWGSGQTLSMVALLGFLVLAGVVVNNGIVFVDYVNQLRIGGRDKKEALVEAGKTRMRPILMTAMTTILAMSTMAFSKEATAQMSKSMAIVTIGGLTYATLMTLFIVPVLYDIFFRKEIKVIDVDLGEEDENIVKAIDSALE